MTTRELTGTIALRDEQDGDGRTVEGIAVPYGVPVRGPTQEYGDATETFQRGAFGDYVEAGGRMALLDRHDGVVVGMARAQETDAGLAYRGRLLDSQAARDYAERVRAGMDSVSIEFTPGRVQRARGAVTHVAGAVAHGIAGTYRPAYQGATVAVREGSTVTTEQQDPQAAPGDSPASPPAFDEARVQALARTVVLGELERAQRAWAELRAGGQVEVSPWAGVRTLGELIQRGLTVERGDPVLNWGQMAYAARALANQTTVDNPGVTTPGVQGEVRGILAANRPVVEAFGRDVPGGSGLTISWPYTTVDVSTLVGVQATEKAEITSVKVPILRAQGALVTYAGGSDISWQLIRRSEPAYLSAYGRLMLAGHAAVTDAAFTAQLVAAPGHGVGLDPGTTSPALLAAIFDASIKVQAATGSPASFVLAGDTLFTRMGVLLYPQPVMNAAGSANAATLNVTVSGLRVIHAPHLPPLDLIVSNGQAAAWVEDGPFQATAEDVAHLGQDQAIWSMGVGAVYVPKGVVLCTAASADAPEGESSSRSRK
jgi:HK97 family phage prohead protease